MCLFVILPLETCSENAHFRRRSKIGSVLLSRLTESAISAQHISTCSHNSAGPLYIIRQPGNRSQWIPEFLNSGIPEFHLPNVEFRDRSILMQMLTFSIFYMGVAIIGEANWGLLTRRSETCLETRYIGPPAHR